MGESYVPIYLDWMEVTEELNDQEKGRLIDAIVLYKAGGDWQERIKGNERYLFPAFRRQIDRANKISDARAIAGSIGGKQNEANASKTKQTQANASKISKDKEKEEEKEKEKDKGVTNHARARFTPPTLDEVKEYAEAHGYSRFNAETFIAYYESNGWKVGRNPMKDWKATVRRWASQDAEKSSASKPAQRNYTEREYTDSDYGDDFFINLTKEV